MDFWYGNLENWKYLKMLAILTINNSHIFIPLFFIPDSLHIYYILKHKNGHIIFLLKKHFYDYPLPSEESEPFPSWVVGPLLFRLTSNKPAMAAFYVLLLLPRILLPDSVPDLPGPCPTSPTSVKHYLKVPLLMFLKGAFAYVLVLSFIFLLIPHSRLFYYPFFV